MSNARLLRNNILISQSLHQMDAENPCCSAGLSIERTNSGCADAGQVITKKAPELTPATNTFHYHFFSIVPNKGYLAK